MIIHYFTLLYVFAPSIFSSSFFSFFECKDSYFFSLVMTRDSFKYTFLSVVALKYGLGSHRSGFLPDLILGNFDDTPTPQSIRLPRVQLLHTKDSFLSFIISPIFSIILFQSFFFFPTHCDVNTILLTYFPPTFYCSL